MKRKILTRCLLIVFIVLSILLVTSLLAVYFSNEDMVDNRLIEETKLVRTLVDDKSDLDKLEGYYKNSDLRITIISRSGEVLYDTNTAIELENHLDREEVKSALEGNPKSVERYSETFGCKMTYYAMTDTFDNGEEVIIRLALRSSDMTSFIVASVVALVVAFVVAIVIAIVFSKKLSTDVSSKIEGVATSLRSLNDGKFEPITVNTGEAEFYSVFNEINEINERTHEHILSEENEKKKFNVVLDNISQGIIALDDSDKIVFVNKKAERMFGSIDDIIAKDISYLIDDSNLIDEIKRCAKEDADTNFEYEYLDKVLSCSICKVQDRMLSTTLSCIVVITDISKEKSIAREKSEFFQNASHELKTPITVMQGLTEVLLTKDNLTDGERKQLNRVHDECLRLAHLVQDMLKLSKLERSREDVLLTNVNLGDVAREVVNELSVTIENKNIDIHILGDGVIKADYRDVYELIENLCSNAVNYNVQGGAVDIDITTEDSTATLIVKDTGIGIAETDLPRICERFYRVDKSRSKRTGGTGLGLAIVKHIVAKYNATMSIDSVVDKGTTITIKFDL